MNTIEELDKLSFPELVDWVSINNKSYKHYSLCVIELNDGSEWAIAFNDNAADIAVYEYISETLWAFKPEFMSYMTELDQVIFDTFNKTGLCESLNPAYRALIDSTCGFENFVDTAISEDGRGHFLSLYDGEEVELNCGAWAYRID